MAVRSRALENNVRRPHWEFAVERYLKPALRAALGLALAAVLIAGAVQLFAKRSEPAAKASTEPVARGTYPPAMGEFPGARAPELPTPQAVATLSVYGQMAREAGRARKLRAFVEQARKHPEAGGISYALAAIAYCNTWEGLQGENTRLEQEATGSSEPKVHERLLALALAAERCEGFAPGEISLEAMYALYGSPAAKHDPIINMQGRLKGARSSDERVEVAREVLGMRDPLLLASAGRMLDAGPNSGSYVDGRKWGGVSHAAYLSAWSLVPCNFGHNCDHSDVEIAVGCVQYGLCYPDRSEKVRARLTPQDYADAIRLHARLVEIVLTADAEALRPPQGTAAPR
jgi:hypothetical protein